MPPRSNVPSRGSFGPPNDTATYKDLLLFEERLKTNAANLQKRKSRYQQVLLPPHISLLSIPYAMLLHWLLPDFYPTDKDVLLHPYVASGLLFVSVTTLVLFFASGMYSEKIAYANKYVPHANRALRNFNMYLNVRKPPLRSKFYWNPLTFFFPRPNEHAQSSRSRSPSPTSRNRPRSASTTRPIQTIPPSTNPRGELIFSSRVDKTFRESYERYRAAFERRREEKLYNELRRKWYGKLMFWKRPPSQPSPGNGGAGVAPPSRTPSNASSRGRGSRSGTPPSTPSISSGGPIMMKQRDRSRTPLRSSLSTKDSVLRGQRDSMDEVDMRTIVLEKSVMMNSGYQS
ncbi:hypothetical protein CVT26_001334 [Gymnopilus dilepis]|uniref:Transmembrane protein 188 n=1 Tax=Gymnopilus dilepis TaxID=231916 RepID=A0A409YUT1_9AGAR|nr:hypothetical protein CVT26_001334 [Gymnopilus dilepis]